MSKVGTFRVYVFVGSRQLSIAVIDFKKAQFMIIESFF